MSHHLDTPLAAQNGQLYIDDLYVFPGQDSTVLVMDVNSDITGAHAEPGFHPEARYEFKVHFDGAELRNPDLPVVVRRTRTVREPGSAAAHPVRSRCAPGRSRQANWSSRAGPAKPPAPTAPGSGPGASRDSFYIDLSLLAIIDEAVAKGTAPDLSGWRPDKARNSFAGTKVDSIVLEVPHSAPASCGRGPAPACGAPPNWPPTPAVGGKSTGLGTP